jgi:hypothetical protein
MASYVAGKELRRLLFGNHVNVPAQTLPQTAALNLFTVAGGRVIINMLLGEVVTAVQNQACTLSFGSLPTVGTGSATSLGTATSIIAAPIGTHFGANPGGATVVDLATQGGSVLGSGYPAVVDTGYITCTTSASNTGTAQWDLFWVPLDDGASVVAL